MTFTKSFFSLRILVSHVIYLNEQQHYFMLNWLIYSPLKQKGNFDLAF